MTARFAQNQGHRRGHRPRLQSAFEFLHSSIDRRYSRFRRGLPVLLIMTFLALTSFEATLLALAVAGAVIALHFLKIYPHRVLVSSVVLWQRVLGEKFSRSLWERLQRIISILLAVTIALLIALSVGRPQIGVVNGKMRRVVIVLDTSPTMNARTSDGSTRWKHATEKARALLAESPASEFRIADTSGQTAFPFTPDRAEALEFLDQLAPSNVQPHFPNVTGSVTV